MKISLTILKYPWIFEDILKDVVEYLEISFNIKAKDILKHHYISFNINDILKETFKYHWTLRISLRISSNIIKYWSYPWGYPYISFNINDILKDILKDIFNYHWISFNIIKYYGCPWRYPSISRISWGYLQISLNIFNFLKYGISLRTSLNILSYP